MKFTTTALFAAAAIGASAHPSGHAHKHAHRSAGAAKFVQYVQPQPSVEAVAAAEPTTTAAEAPAKTTAAQADQDDDSSSSGGDSGVDTYTDFCGGKSKRATVAEIAYTGNIGTADDYGCNMMLVKSNVAKKYNYIAAIKNASDKQQECVAYLKIGPENNEINGFFKGKEAKSFSIPAGVTQHLAVDENTQGGVICQVGGIETTKWGEYASTWAEFDMANTSNDGWSGADASCLVASRYDMTIPGLQICGHDTCSTINPGGTGTNAFLKGMEAEDGWGLNIPAGDVWLDITVGYEGGN
ncbi:Allergen Asp f-like protein [Emericellopsis cladophorae]|uniref:Allergen Asp f-like protein n=1 Tax=Emericellopsis cladophorae TaxID=2686198 RepID=A0A9P9Y3A3_9HYPO|nr:Allergen Asp f-like protein [Emericellopsis cladophorae]KAI6782754.1 Allergen Asp f-like protein [Emericellopsis cladophorae]